MVSLMLDSHERCKCIVKAGLSTVVINQSLRAGVHISIKSFLGRYVRIKYYNWLGLVI